MAFGLGTIYLWMQASVEITNPCPGKRKRRGRIEEKTGGNSGSPMIFVGQVYFTFLVAPPSYPGLITWARVWLALLDSLCLVATVLSGFTAWLVLECHGWVGGGF